MFTWIWCLKSLYNKGGFTVVKMNRSIMGLVVGLAVLSCVLTGFAIAADDSEAPSATETTISHVGGTLAGGAGGAAGGAGGGATGGGGADVRVAQY